ncbi:MAG: hypothetical protein SNJ29_11240 [Rikenellaceae bacterium]
MGRALSPTEVLSQKRDVLPFEGEWFDAFGHPEKTGVWFIWGNSGNGKTSFMMQLCKELAKFGKVGYNSLEEGVSLSMQNAIKRYGLAEQNRRVVFFDCMKMADLSEKLKKPRQPKFIIIDSFQYTQMNYKDYIKFKEAHRDKLLIFVSHASGSQPSGRSAVSVMYDASLKIWVQHHRAFSKGRFIGERGYFNVWEEEANRLWGENNNKGI